MSEPFTCSCGMKTRQPFKIGGEMLCALCVEQIAPQLVTHRAARNWQQWTRESHHVPTRPGYQPRWKDEDDR